MNIGEVIKDRRQKKNMTQADLAALLNVTPQAVSRWEMNISYPDVAMVPEIAKVLHITTDELLGVGQTDGEENGDSRAETVLNQSQADSIFDYVASPVSGKRKKILVVDDSEYMRKMLAEILTGQGHTVIQAGNGQECLDTLEKEPADVCILDINMPVMDGFEALRRMREAGYPMKVIMISALSQEGNVKLAMQLGAEAFIVKPFGVECLLQRVG